MTDEEVEMMTELVGFTLSKVCEVADKHNYDRDNILQHLAIKLIEFASIASIQNYQAEGGVDYE